MGMWKGWGKEGDGGMNWESGVDTYTLSSVQLSSVTQSCPTSTPWTAAHQASLFV